MAGLIAWLYGCFLLCAIAGAAPPVFAQAPQPPAGLSKAQFDALVDAIGDAVARKLNVRPTDKSAATTPAIVLLGLPHRYQPDGQDSKDTHIRFGNETARKLTASESANGPTSNLRPDAELKCQKADAPGVSYGHPSPPSFRMGCARSGTWHFGQERTFNRL